ncbi:Rap1a/Tai family immunity protein [Cupriavidus sp. a3]|uniref:Rap1a/Tai family immunity protein n=1 Tax=Cupriavidus sp. a3 TaxID=3242158 RepID=UPI003D9C209D
MRDTLFAMALMLCLNLAQAQETTAAQLAKECSSDPSTAKTAEELVGLFRCIGYVSGVLDTHAVMVGVYRSQKAFCAPADGVSHESAILALLQWLNRKPTRGDMSARSAVLLALRERFPC